MRYQGIEQAQVRGQTDTTQIIAVNNRLSRILPQRSKCPSVFESFDDAVGNLFGGEEVDEQAVTTVVDHFLDGLGARTDHEASSRHRLEHRPGEHEGVSKIDMNT